jgi:hypothetical protein
MKGKLRDFELLEDGFTFKGAKFSDSLVHHIFYSNAHTVIKTNLVHTAKGGMGVGLGGRVE